MDWRVKVLEALDERTVDGGVHSVRELASLSGRRAA